MSLFQGINVVSISVTDLAVAREFYGSTLGLGEPEYDLAEMGWIEFRTGGPTNISVTVAEDGWQPSTGTTVALNTTDCRATFASLQGRAFGAMIQSTYQDSSPFAAFTIRSGIGCKCAARWTKSVDQGVVCSDGGQSSISATPPRTASSS